MKVETYERAFLWLGGLLLIACLGALLYASVAMGIHLPGRVGTLDPAEVRATPPFDALGVRQLGPNAYEVVMIGQIWAFLPNEVRVPAGAEITFTATSADVLHGFHIDGTRINMMLIPGQISRNTYRFEEPGQYVILCHEYCGIGHHKMYGLVIVE